MILTGEKPKYWRKPFGSAILPDTDLMWTSLGSTLGLRGERPATNRLSLGAARYKTGRERMKSMQLAGDIFMWWGEG